MNDRFKFRFYDKDKKIMIDENSDYDTINSIYGKDEWWWCVEANMPTVFEYFEQQSCWDGKKDFVIMQCTGLKDKNRKLIYEGDVVRYAEYEIDDTEPEWKYDEIVWGDKHSYPAFDLANNQFECNGLSYIINEGWTIEVIGNKFENPELLKECE